MAMADASRSVPGQPGLAPAVPRPTSPLAFDALASVSTSISTTYQNARISAPIIIIFPSVREAAYTASGNKPRRMAA